jgi:IS6 family transposase
VAELLAERGVDVDHVTIYRWVQRFTPLVIDTARPCRHSVGDRWFVYETYIRVSGVWRYLYRAVDQHSQVIAVYVSKRRNVTAAARFFETMLEGRERPSDVTTDLAAPLLRVVDELLGDVFHDTTRYGNNKIECDHARLKARLRPMRGLGTDRTASTVIRGTRSSRICDAATTNSASKPVTIVCVSRQRSTNSPKRSDLPSGLRPYEQAPDRPMQRAIAVAHGQRG